MFEDKPVTGGLTSLASDIIFSPVGAAYLGGEIASRMGRTSFLEARQRGMNWVGARPQPPRPDAPGLRLGGILDKSARRKMIEESGLLDPRQFKGEVGRHSKVWAWMKGGKTWRNPRNLATKGGRVPSGVHAIGRVGMGSRGRLHLRYKAGINAWNRFSAEFLRRTGSRLVEGGISSAWDYATSQAAGMGMKGKWGAARLLGGALGRTAISAMNWGFGAQLAVDITTGALSMLEQIGRPPDTTPRFYDNPANATMRQSAMQAIYDSQLSTRSAFGKEASFMHR